MTIPVVVLAIVPEYLRHLGVHYQEAGVFAVLRLLKHSIYRRDIQYVVAKDTEVVTPPPGSHSIKNRLDVDCKVVDSLDSLRTVWEDSSARFRDSVDDLARRLKQGCMVFLACPREQGKGAPKVVGYNICERGVFSALERKQQLSTDILFIHYVEVLEEYRGRRIQQLIDAAISEYCRANGVKKICAVISPDNLSSIRAHLSSGFEIVGKVQKVSVLRGFFVWETPWPRVEKALS